MSVRKFAFVATVSAVALATSGAFAHVATPDLQQRLESQLANPHRLQERPFDAASPQQRRFTVFLKDGSAASVATVEKYFQAFGFKTTYMPHTNALRLDGTYAQAEAAGHFRYQVKTYPTGVSIPRLSTKASFAPEVAGLIDHATFYVGPKMHPLHQFTRPGITDTTIPLQGYGPPDYAKFLNIPTTVPGGSAPLDGTGSVIDIAACGNVSPSDFTFFQNLYKTYLTKAPTLKIIEVAPHNYPYYGVEPTLDVERVYGTAPGASINLYTIPDCTSSEWETMEAQILEDQATTPADALTISYGTYEGVIDYYGLDTDYFTNQSAGLAKLAASGVTIFAASGDSGAFFYRAYDVNIHVDVSYPASDPSVLGVGGTTLLSTGAGTANVKETAEYAWSGGGFSGSGGGVSSHFTAPSYQQHFLGLGPSAPKQVPDLAAIGDPYTGATLAFTPCYWFENYPPTTPPTYYLSCFSTEVGAIGGTSASSPTVAGVLALIDQAAGARVPNVGKLIYKAAKVGAFNDITAGDNGFYKAKARDATTNPTGYDNVTGVGTPNVTNLLKAAAAAAGG